MAARIGGKRPLRALAITAALALTLAACGGGDDDGDGDAPAAGDAAAGDNAGAPDADQAGSGANLQDFEAWAAPLRDARTASIGAEGDGDLANVTIASPGEAGLVWRADTARIVNTSADGIVLAPDGQAIQIGAGGYALAIDAGRVEISSAEGSEETPASVVLEASDVVVNPDAGEAASTIADLEVAMHAADEAGAVGRLTARGMTLGGDSARPFGNVVDELTLAFAPAADGTGLTISAVRVRWGSLDLEGTGALAVDPSGAVSGELVAEVFDILTPLDTYHAYSRFDREVYGAVFAALLEEVGADPDNLQTVTIEIADGVATIPGDARGVPDLQLTDVVPVGAAAGQ